MADDMDDGAPAPQKPGLRDQIKGAIDEHKEPDGDEPVGLAQNAEGVPFQCGTCQYFDEQNSLCQNDNPKLNGQQVQPDWCCNLYDHEGMQHIID